MSKPESTQEELQRLRSQVAQLRNKAALGELLGTTTHEFNNILMTIMNYAKMGIRHPDQATRDKALDKILAASERAAKITHSVLGMAKNRSGDFAPVDLAQLFDETMVLLSREMQQFRVQVEIQVEPNLPKVHAIGNQIQQVILNLLTNARQAMDKGGQITIKLFQSPQENYVGVSIRDYGCGMPPEVLHRIFEPYFTTKTGPDASGKGGTGLGLSACKDVIEQHQGRIRVDSSVGKGTMFTLYLPISPANEVRQPSEMLAVPAK
ncbi:MAG: sensor histidine kinase [Planctomycetaceae bacterium]|nr:sensor histidine kinase [Planctomycetaceae bacterium]